VALANIHGPQAGLEALAAVREREGIQSYYLLYAALGEFEAQLDHHQAAAAHFRKSLELAELKSERTFLSKRLRETELTGLRPPDHLANGITLA